MEKNYSIIIPHKNIPHLLQRCLDSIPRRDDVQIIVVDDNSDPSIVDFDHFPGVGEKCVEVYLTKEGKGAGYARNVGLEHAEGKWLLFADADDFFENKFIEIVDNHQCEDADIIYFASRSVDCYTLKEAENRCDILPYIKRNAIKELMFMFVPWGKMIKRQLIDKNNLRFEEVVAANDALFSVMAGIKACTVKAYNECIYVSTIRKDSLFSLDTKERLESRIAVGKKINQINKRYKLKYRCNIYMHIIKIKKISKEEYKKNLYTYLSTESILHIVWDLVRYYKIVLIDCLKYKCRVRIDY